MCGVEGFFRFEAGAYTEKWCVWRVIRTERGFYVGVSTGLELHAFRLQPRGERV